MPGFNQRGPMNEGPMTGRQRGICTGYAMSGQGFGGRGYGMGSGMGRGMGRRGNQAPGRGLGYGQWNTPAPMTSNRDVLQNRADMLEAELTAIKNQLKSMSEPTD